MKKQPMIVCMPVPPPWTPREDLEWALHKLDKIIKWASARGETPVHSLAHEVQRHIDDAMRKMK